MNVLSRLLMPKDWCSHICHVVGICLVLGCLALVGGTRTAADERPKEEKKVSSLSIELRLSKDHYRVSEKVDAEIIFRNQGKEKLLIPLEKDNTLFFFEFLIIGDQGTQFLTKHGQGWGDPEQRHIKFVPLGPGETYKVSLCDIIPLKSFDAGVHPKEQYKVLAIYRDCYYGHARVEPGLWKGTVSSPLVSIKSITSGDPEK